MFACLMHDHGNLVSIPEGRGTSKTPSEYRNFVLEGALKIHCQKIGVPTSFKKNFGTRSSRFLCMIV